MRLIIVLIYRDHPNYFIVTMLYCASNEATGSNLEALSKKRELEEREVHTDFRSLIFRHLPHARASQCFLLYFYAFGTRD